jgi:hypothetical protein
MYRIVLTHRPPLIASSRLQKHAAGSIQLQSTLRRFVHHTRQSLFPANLPAQTTEFMVDDPVVSPSNLYLARRL